MTITTTVTRAGHGHRRAHAQYHHHSVTGDWAVMWAEPTENGYKFAIVKKGFATKTGAKRWWTDLNQDEANRLIKLIRTEKEAR